MTTLPATPVGERERLESLDLLRGVAVLGILVMNIQMFAMVFAMYFNPHALGPAPPGEFAVWAASHLFFDQKMMTIFSLLFGAGVLLMTSRADERGAAVAAVHYRRMFWLLVFGLAHAYLLWHGDILVLYAICGMLVFPFRRLRPGMLIAVGMLSLAVASGIYVAAGLSMPTWPPEAVAEMRTMWQPDAAEVARETAAFRGGWLTQLPMRAEFSFGFQTFTLLVWGMWRAGGLMLIGMGLMKLGVFSGARSRAFYVTLVIAGFGIGLPIVGWGIVRNIANGWDLYYSFFLGQQWNYWGSVLVSFGWIGLIVVVWQSGAMRGAVHRLAAVGRMAFTCYILETVLSTLVFYGHGAGLFGVVPRTGQVLVTLAIWAVLLLFAPAWLGRYRFGPLEWLWRTLTYGRVERLRRDAPAPAPAL